MMAPRDREGPYAGSVTGMRAGRYVGALVVLLLAAVLHPRFVRAEDGPTRILLVGDSVTQGQRGDHTRGYFLWKALQTQPDPVDLVGDRTGTFTVRADGTWDHDYNGPDAYADPAFDQDHSAVWGGRLSEDGWWRYQDIGPQVAAHQPHVVMAMWGINDLAREELGPTELVALYRSWVADARAAKPDVELVISRLPYTWLLDGEVVAFNDLVDDLAAELTTSESPIVVATMTAPYTWDDSTDGVHPNTSGQQKIAQMMTAALVELRPGLAPRAQPVVPVVTPPTATPVVVPAAQPTTPGTPGRVRAVREGRRTTVTWRRAAGATGYEVRCGTRSRTTSATSTRMRVSSVRCRVRSVNTAGTSRWVRVRVRV